MIRFQFKTTGLVLIGDTARERMANLEARERRLQYAMAYNAGTEVRRLALEHARDRLWYAMYDLRFSCHLEEIEEAWPDGMPAHP